MTNTKALGMALVVVAIAIGVSAFFAKEPSREPVGASTGPFITDYLELVGGALNGNVNATTTHLNAIVAAPGELAFKDTVILTQVRTSSAPATTTVTLPASSTLPHWLPKVGMRQRQCWISGTSTPANPGFILVAGTGIDLETASTTATGLTVNGGAGACIEFVRDQLTNLKGFITIFRDAD